MADGIGLQDLFMGTMSGAAIVLLGAFYALFFALARLHRSSSFVAASLGSYLLLVGAVAVLVDALALDGIWIAITVVMLIGYYALPRAIWRLCVGTHGENHIASNKGAPR